MKEPRNHEGFSSLLLQYLQVGMVVHNADGRIILANDEAHRMLGLAAGGLDGRSARDPGWVVFREDGAPLPPDEYPANVVLATGSPVRNFILGFDHAATGERVWVLVSAFQETAGSERAGQVVVTFIDITARKRLEAQSSDARFRAMVEGAPDSIFIQVQGKFAYLNPAMCRLLGAASPDQVVGTPVVDRVHPDYRAAVAARIRRLNEDRAPVPDLLEVRFLRMDGTEAWAETAG